MALIFQDLGDYLAVYVDDVLIFSDTLEEHVQHLRDVFTRLRKERLFVNGKKCSFAQPEVEYCGFILGTDGVRPQPEKLAVVRAWPTPTSVDEVRSFLGLCGFYQRFVKDYATIAAPMTNLTRKRQEWSWGPLSKLPSMV